jgi:hypothetical protein
VQRYIYGPSSGPRYEEGYSELQLVFARPSRLFAIWLAAVLILNLGGLYLLDRLGLGLAGIAWVPIVTVTALDILKAETSGSTAGVGLNE